MSDSEDDLVDEWQDDNDATIGTSPTSVSLEGLPGLFERSSVESHPEHVNYEVSHSINVLKGLSKQREEGLLCDVILAVGDQRFPCHRNVLAACSPYFMAMFTGNLRERDEQIVEICGIEPEVMKQLIDYAYTADMTITAENAQHLMSAANMVQMIAICEYCCKFLEKEMDPSNCLGIHCFAEAHSCEALAETAMKFTLKNFPDVAKHEEIQLLSKDKLIEIISDDRLMAESEEVVLQATIAWVKYDVEKRSPATAEVLQHVRLPLISPYYLFDIIEQEPFLIESVECRRLLDEAKKLFILKDRQAEIRSERMTPRDCKPTQKLLITIGGEIYSKNYLTSVDAYSVNEGRWMRLKDLPFPRCQVGTAVSDGKYVYVAGGFSKEKVVLNNVLRYEAVLDKWIRVANMNVPRARHGMAALDGYIYAIGGCDGQSRTDTVERYNPVTNRWVHVANMKMALSMCEACALNGYLYVIGGIDINNRSVDYLQRYDPIKNTWDMLAPMNGHRTVNGVVSADGQLYAVGGSEEAGRVCKRLTRYDPIANKWEELNEMIEPRFDAGVALLGKKIFVLSGHDGENSFYHNIEEYDINSDAWSIVSATSMPYGRCRFGCVAMEVPTW